MSFHPFNYKGHIVAKLSWAYSQSGYQFLTIGFKDFIFGIFQIQNLYGINLGERYWIIQIMIIFMVVVIFHMHM
jgi:hypothetical protein